MLQTLFRIKFTACSLNDVMIALSIVAGAHCAHKSPRTRVFGRARRAQSLGTRSNLVLPSMYAHIIPYTLCVRCISLHVPAERAGTGWWMGGGETRAVDNVRVDNHTIYTWQQLISVKAFRPCVTRPRVTYGRATYAPIPVTACPYAPAAGTAQPTRTRYTSINPQPHPSATRPSDRFAASPPQPTTAFGLPPYVMARTLR